MSPEARSFTEAQAGFELAMYLGGVSVCLYGGSAEASGWQILLLCHQDQGIKVPVLLETPR